MKILFVTVVFLCASSLFADEPLSDAEKVFCNRDQATLAIDHPNDPIPNCNTKNDYAQIKQMLKGGSNPIANSQPKKQDSPVVPEGNQRDPNKFNCNVRPFWGGSDVNSWNDCLAKAKALYCGDVRDTLPLVTFSKDDIQKQLTKADISCPDIAKKGLKVTCRSDGQTVGMDGGITKMFSSSQECANYMKSQLQLKIQSDTSLCLIKDMLRDPYPYTVNVQLGNSDQVDSFSYNIPCHSSQKKPLPTSSTQPPAGTQPESGK